MDLESRFWNKIIIQDNDDCWEWMGCKDSCGYGCFGFRGRTQKAHRVMWLITYGEIPATLNVLHKCDNPSCVNPDHLFLGTQKDNVLDMMKKHRRFCVPSHLCISNRKLRNFDVSMIKLLLEERVSRSIIANIFNVSLATICYINKNKIWKNII